MFDRSPLRFSIRRAVISSFCACAALLTGVKSLSAADPAPDGWLSVRSKVTGLVSYLSGQIEKRFPSLLQKILLPSSAPMELSLGWTILRNNCS